MSAVGDGSSGSWDDDCAHGPAAAQNCADNISYPTHRPVREYVTCRKGCQICNRRDLVLAFPRVLMESGDAQKTRLANCWPRPRRRLAAGVTASNIFNEPGEGLEIVVAGVVARRYGASGWPRKTTAIWRRRSGRRWTGRRRQLRSVTIQARRRPGTVSAPGGLKSWKSVGEPTEIPLRRAP
jgi:hypothetical protein